MPLTTQEGPLEALNRIRRSIAIALAVSLPLAVGAAVLAPASAQGAWGSIAVNPKSGGAGIASGKKTRPKAKRAARRACPGNCKSIVWVRNGCAAVYRNDVRFVWGAARKKQVAINRAKRRAQRDGEGPARRVAWMCSG